MALTSDWQTSQQVKHIHRLMRKRIGVSALKDSLQPLWYRGLSDSQLAATHGLKRALADDLLQGSAHRAHRQLCHLGVRPRPNRDGVRLLLQLSRANDVAFLWFLMEMFYKPNQPDIVYQFNEQIIMSAIFYLDLFPTLQELDRVLPLPHESAAVRLKQAQDEERKQKQQRLKRMREKSRLARLPETTQKLPYFQKPVLRIPRRQHLLAQPPDLAPLLPRQQDNQSTFQTPWFSNFVFRDGERIARSVLNTEVERAVTELGDAGQLDSLCVHHKQIREMEQSLQWNLERIKREQYERLVDVEYHKRKRNRERVLNDLERMSEKFRSKFHDMAVKESAASNRKRLVLEKDDPGFQYLGKKQADWMSEEDLCGTITSSEKFQLIDRREPLPPTCRDNCPQKAPRKPELKRIDGDAPLKEVKSCRLRLTGSGIKEEPHQRSDPPSGQPDSRSQYFKRDPNGQLHSFNYNKLFAPSREKLLSDQATRIKAEFIKALEDDVEYLDGVLDGSGQHSLDELVSRTMKRIYREGTELFQAQYKINESNPAERLSFGQEFYDADDLQLMKNMLLRGLERVSRDNRLVLPTLPDVHSHPLLLEWIQSRYGKRYSEADRERSFRKSKLIMDNLALLLVHSIVLTPCRQPDPKLHALFVAHNKPRAKLKKYWNQYLKHFLVALLEIGRVFHAAMLTHQSKENSATYYAYMPAHFDNVLLSEPSPTFQHTCVDNRDAKYLLELNSN